MSDISTSLLSPTKHSCNNKWKEPNKWQASMNDRNCKESSTSSSRASLPPVITHCASVNDICQATLPREGKWQESNIDVDGAQDRSKISQRAWDASQSIETNSRPSPQHQNNLASPQTPEEWNPLHGSMSDVSQANLALHSSSKQLIAHSARVQTPQRHHSESVLYLDRERSQRKLYPISTTQPQEATTDFSSRRMSVSPVSPQQAHLSVAERISELEKQQQQAMRYTYLDPDKRHRVSDPTLKAIQKKALLSFYERHHQSSWRSEPQLAQGAPPTAQSPPPQPPPRPRPSSSRRASSASDYSSGTWREKTSRGSLTGSDAPSPKHQHSNSCGSLSTDLLGPVIVGPAISIDDWVPERPPKKAHLRAAYNDRVPSPDLPPPSPPTVTENEVMNCDDPLPPPPPELSDNSSIDSVKETSPREIDDSKKRHRNSQGSDRQSSRRSKHGKRAERDDRTSKSSPINSPTKNNSTKQIFNDNQQSKNFVRSTSLKHADADFFVDNGVPAGFATHRMVPTGRSSLRYPSAQKLMLNGRAGQVKRVEERCFSSRPPARLPDLVSQRYSDSGNQRPAPQVPVESRIIRQESMRVESTRMDASGLLRNDTGAPHRYETSSGQRPQPQVPKSGNGNEKNFPTSGPVARPNYLAVGDGGKSPARNTDATGSHGYGVSSPVKTGYEASSKLLAEACPQKYHEPPKYVPAHHHQHQRIVDGNGRNYYALPSKYVDGIKQKPQPQCPGDRFATAEPGSPPPLAPRQNTPGRKSLPPPPRPAPPQSLQG